MGGVAGRADCGIGRGVGGVAGRADCGVGREAGGVAGRADCGVGREVERSSEDDSERRDGCACSEAGTIEKQRVSTKILAVNLVILLLIAVVFMIMSSHF